MVVPSVLSLEGYRWGYLPVDNTWLASVTPLVRASGGLSTGAAARLDARAKPVPAGRQASAEGVRRDAGKAALSSGP